MSVRRSVAVLVCWTLLLGAVAPPAIAGATVSPAEAVDDSGAARPATVAGTVSAPNNTTVRHRNPDDGDRAGDLAAVQDHLAGEMSEVVIDCSRALSVGGFGPCEGLNGSYRDSLSKYVELSRETETDRDDDTARSFRRVRREGREYARTVREFRDSYGTYREARASGDAERARRAARELRSLADRADRTGGNLTLSLRNVTRSGTDVTPAVRTVDETTANVTRTVEEIERDLFVGTVTTARVNDSTASFLDPLVVSGRVTTANGTAVSGAQVGLARVRGGTATERVDARTRTNATGHYRLRYRPVTTPLGSVVFAARLLPESGSAFLPSNATVNTRVEQVTANLTVRSAPAEAAYADRLRVRVRVTAGDGARERVAVEGLPVHTRIGEYRIGSGRTDGDGGAAPDGRFPAAVRTGEQRLVVGFEGSERAIAPATETVELDVRETATTVDATVRNATARRLTVEGRLTTADGRPLANRPVRVTLAGRSLGWLRSGPDGSFEGDLTVPARVLPSEGTTERQLRLAFDGTGRNLGSTETALTVLLRAPAGGPDESTGEAAGVGTGYALLVAALLLALVGGAVLLDRWRSADDEPPGDRDADRGSEPAGSAVDGSTALAAVRAAMGSGDYDLVTTAGYRAVRRALAGRVDAGPGATHWEFYGACAADGIDADRLEAVRRLTERFERVAFASDEASRSVAAAALADAETVLERGGNADAGSDESDEAPTDGAPTNS